MMAALSVAAMTVGELVGAGAGAFAQVAVHDLALDSRQVTPGAAFVALPGGRRHGLEFAADALAQGAAIVLYEPAGTEAPAPDRALAVPGLQGRLGDLARRFFGRGAFPSALLGVTGTNGKTTVAYLVAQAMTGAGNGCAYVGTLGFGVPPALTPHALTTPDCLTLHRELAIAAAGPAAARHAALEVSSHALAQDRIAGLDVATAVFTNLTRDHLDWHGDFERYGEAKAKLFTRPGLRHAVLNVDDAFSVRLAGRLPRGCEAIRVSLGGARDADVVGRCRAAGVGGTTVEISGRYGDAEIVSPLIGRFNAENLLLAAAALVAWQVPLGDAAAALAAAGAPPGRMQVFGGGPGRATVVVDYAHTPDALERVLETVADAAAGDVWCVFGCGGERDAGKRAAMGEAAARHARHVVLTDDNPRGEDPAAIVADILEGLAGHGDVAVEHDRERAIRTAIERAAPGDVVLVAGRGHEAWQVHAGGRRALDDRAVVARVLEALG